MFKKFFSSEGGFTLVELLVTIAILAVLFGIVSLTLSGVGDNAETTVKAAECGVVQSAADIWLAAAPGNTIAGYTTAGVNIGPSPAQPAEFQVYLRDLPTSYTYTWTSTGEVTCCESGGTCP